MEEYEDFPEKKEIESCGNEKPDEKVEAAEEIEEKEQEEEKEELEEEDEEEEDEDDNTLVVEPNSTVLPWGAHKERISHYPSYIHISAEAKPGEYVMQTLFAEFTFQAARKIDMVLAEPLERTLSKSLQRGEDPFFDQLLSCLSSVAEHCLPSLLRVLFEWYDRQNGETGYSQEHKQRADSKGKGDMREKDYLLERRDLAVDFIFCLVLIEVLKQLPVHPGHEDLIIHIETLAFKHFKYRDGSQAGPNATNVHIIADLYAEVIGVLAQSRFQSVRKKFMMELKELRSKEQNPYTAQSIISLLMGMKFFRVKMVPIEEFEASFQFMQECALYFLEVKDKDIKHALAGLFVEILVPVAATVKNEVNVPCLKNFVEMLYSQTLDMSTKKKHALALFPLVTCLLCVSQKKFFLSSWHYFLAMCLQHLKNREPKLSRVALESLYRLLWVYMIRIKCESNSATQSRLQSIVNSLFPKGSKVVVPRDTPLNIFVKIIQFIAQERLDFAMKEIVFDLLCVGRPVKMLTPERMSIGLRAFLVMADSLQQREGDPPMPRTIGVLPSGNTLRVKKTFLNKMLTEETAKSIGMSVYYPYVRKAFDEILRVLDVQVGRPMMMTMTQNANKEPDDMITGERKPKIDLFRTCVAAIPRLIPDGMTRQDLVDLLSRLTVHMDEELRGLAFQSLQTFVLDFPDWREDVVHGFIQFIVKDVNDTYPSLVDNALRMLAQFLTSWKNAIQSSQTSKKENAEATPEHSKKYDPLANSLHCVEGFALMMLCNCRNAPRKLAVHLLKEVKILLKLLGCTREDDHPVITVIDRACSALIEKCLPLLPPAERVAILSTSNIDLQWLVDRSSSVWASGYHDNINSELASKMSASVGSSLSDPWSLCLSGFMGNDYVTGWCLTAIAHAWPMVYTRLNALFPYVDPNSPTNDNRASLLRTSKKLTNERDLYMNLWHNYLMFACSVAPPTVTPGNFMRCASPELNLSSSPDSCSSDRSESRAPGVPSISANGLYKMVVPLLRSESNDMRDSVINGLGKINADALKDLMEELVPYIKEAIDRKQENMRRRRRRDGLRLTLAKLLELIADVGTFGQSNFVVDREAMCLSSTFLDYIEGARLYLESESEKDIPIIKEIRLHFSQFICKLIKSFPVEHRDTLLSREKRYNLFYLFANWSGRFGVSFRFSEKRCNKDDSCTELELAALQAMSAVLCCGSVFDPNGLSDDGYIYSWLDTLLGSHDEKIKGKIYQLAQETIVLLLEFNPDINTLLDWVVDQCYTGSNEVADGCFNALATVFSNREYPCDQYTAIINVTLLNTGCPRTNIHETALQLLQVLDKRFFGSPPSLIDETLDANVANGEDEDLLKYRDNNTLNDMLLSATYSRSQFYLSEQLARLHPALTMPMFSEITHRFQTARPSCRQLLLHYLLPWLYNIELVDPRIPSGNPLSNFLNKMQDYYQDNASKSPLKGDGWGSPEATEMVLNNLFYIMAKFGDEHPKEIEQLWASLCVCWPNNLKVIIRYLFILSGMSPNELLPYAKRVIVYLGKAKPERLVDEMMNELQTVETLNCTIERTETPPFFRLTCNKKLAAPADTAAIQTDTKTEELLVEKGTLHTKRHSTEDPANKDSPTNKRDPCGSIGSTSSSFSSKMDKTIGTTCTTVCTTTTSLAEESQSDDDPDYMQLRKDSDDSSKSDPSPLCPLPMPEYGGYFAPLTEFLPDSSQLVAGFHRCNLAVMLLTDLVVEGINVDWSVHLPLMLHIIFLGLDQTRMLVHEHCKKLLLNLLVALSYHNDHLAIARILLNNKTLNEGYALTSPAFEIKEYNFTDATYHGDNQPSVFTFGQSTFSVNSTSTITPESFIKTVVDVDSITKTEDVAKALIDFLASRKCRPLWSYEDITAKVWSIKSAEQLETFLRHVLRVFRESLPQAQIEQRWAQVALQLALSCSSRHYAGRSLQIFRALRVPINSRMLSDILSRLVETVAEQGEDMQGYVTEIMLTLEAAVESLDTDFRPIDFVKELFKSTPNLNKDNRRSALLMSNSQSYPGGPGHTRSTSYSVCYVTKKGSTSPPVEAKDNRHRSVSDADSRKSTNLSRSRSAQSLKMLADQNNQDDKMTILSQLFWIAVSLLESDYEHEFLLALRLLDTVLKRFPLDRPDCREKLDKILQQLKWSQFPGVQAVILKGCTCPSLYEPTLHLLSKFTSILDCPIVDPSQAAGFPMNVIALLPYMVQKYEDPDQLCIQSAENIAQICLEKSKKLENLATVMTLYSRRTFNKESFQWTKCVVKYLFDAYTNYTVHTMAFLVEVLERGPSSVQQPILNILHCMLHYVDMNSAANQVINGDILRVIAKYVEGTHWKDSMKILKLVVTRSSTLAAPPASVSVNGLNDSTSLSSHMSFADAEISFKKELPGRTLEFCFDLSQTPIIGRKYQTEGAGKEESNIENKEQRPAVEASPRRTGLSRSMSTVDGENYSGWKRPFLSQARTRERLVNLLTSCGQRVGLPKSPSVIFSQSSDIIERQSSMCSSSEEISLNNELSVEGKLDDSATSEQQFGIFKDFDFLEYELESAEGESMDNFNWGVRRRSLNNLDGDHGTLKDCSLTGSVPNLSQCREESSDDEMGSVSPVDELSSSGGSFLFHSNALAILDRSMRHSSPTTGSSHSICSDTDIAELTPSNSSPCFSSLTTTYISIQNDEIEEIWRTHVTSIMSDTNGSCAINTYLIFARLFKETRRRLYNLTRESCYYLSMNESLRIIAGQFLTMLEVLVNQAECPHIFTDAETMLTCRLLERHKFCVLEIHEHFETYIDKKDHTVECLDSIKSTIKLQTLGESFGDYSTDEQYVDLCRCLYKLHFQFLLLFECYSKLISLLSTASKAHQVPDLSKEVTLLKHELTRAMCDLENGQTSPVAQLDPGSFNKQKAESYLLEFLLSKKFLKAIQQLRSYRSMWPNEAFGRIEEEDVDILLSLYCQHLAEKRSGILVITRPDHDLSEVCSRLMDVNVQLSASIRVLEKANHEKECLRKSES